MSDITNSGEFQEIIVKKKALSEFRIKKILDSESVLQQKIEYDEIDRVSGFFKLYYKWENVEIVEADTEDYELITDSHILEDLIDKN